jgi:hypothetical protein
MKWIGQDIYDFIARFRNDVILEGATSGTPQTFISIDANRKIVTGIPDITDSNVEWRGAVISKAYGGTGLSSYTQGDILYYDTGGSLSKLGIGSAGEVLKVNSGATAPEWGTDAAGLSFNGSEANGILTYGSSTQADVESQLTFNSTTLTIGGDDDTLATVNRLAHGDGIGGILKIAAGNSLADNTAGGALQLSAGLGKGSGGGGNIEFYSNLTDGTAGDTGAVNQTAVLTKEGNLTIDGDLTISGGNITNAITFDSGLTGALSGNAATATALATARAINGVDFDGTAAITITAAGSTLSDTVTVAKGGTGATSLNDTHLLIGNGTSAVETTTSLTYSSSAELFSIGDGDNGRAEIVRTNGNDSGGGQLRITGGRALNGGTSNLTGGDLELVGGAGVGDGASGGIRFYNWNTVGSGNNPQTVINEIAAITGAGNLQLDGGITTGSTSFVNSSGVIQVATQGTIDHDSLANYVANEHIDWTSASAGTIDSSNIPTLNQDTTGTAGIASIARRVAGETDQDVLIGSDGEVIVKLDSDNDESTQKFKITDSSDTEVFSIMESGFATFTSTVAVASRISNSGSDSDLTIDCDGNMIFVIDADDDESSQSFSFRDTVSTEVASISDKGVVTATGFIQDGDFSVSPGDGVAIHVDTADITDAVTAASGTALTYNHVAIENPRLLASNSNVTTTNASTLYIKGAPVAHTNQTITNSFAIYVAGGTSYFGGAITANGGVTGDLTGNAATATNLVASTSTAVQLGTIELGHASDTTIHRTHAGRVAIEGAEIQTTNKHRHFINFGVNLGYSYARYLPWGSYYIFEQNTDSNPEYTTYVAPHDGVFKSLKLRSEVALGSTVITIYKVGDGTEEPDQGSVVDTKTVDIASANTVYTYTFDSDATFSSGDAMSCKIDPTGSSSIAGSPGVVGTFSIEFDLTT